jgi:hypothetical protein
MRVPSFVGPSYTSQSKIASCEKTQNWYPERIEAPDAKSTAALYPCPGYTLLVTLAEGPVRGWFAQNGRLFVVGGTKLYELDATWVATERGSGLNYNDGAPATISSNGDAGHQLFITSGSKGYVYDLTTDTLTFVVDGATQGGFLDSFFLAVDPLENKLKISESEDGLTWDVLQVEQRSDASDRWAAVLVVRKEIWLWGSQTTSIYYDAGATPFPFLPNPSAFFNIGILAPASAAIVDNAPMWLGQTTEGAGIVYRANGYAPQRVSTHALEYAMSTYSTLLDAVAWTYQDQGHSFYVLRFPTANATWVFDASTGLWHERTSAVYGHAYAFGSHLVGSTTTGAVYRMATSIATDTDGTGLQRLRRGAHLSSENVRLRFTRFEVALEAGLGLTTGQGSDPQVMLRWSDDGGQTWSNERWVSAGAVGAYKARAIWRQLGQARDRVFEVSVSDPIPWRLLDAYVDVQAGNS